MKQTPKHRCSWVYW